MHLNAILLVEGTVWALHQRELLVFYRRGLEFACSSQGTNTKKREREMKNKVHKTIKFSIQY